MDKWTVADIPPEDGKLAIVTGANSGIGWHTALELARARCEVVLTVRSEAKGHDAVDRIMRHVPEAKIRYEILDLADLSSVRAFVSKMGKEKKVDILVNNAGVMNVPERRTTKDGFELQFGTNFLGHFALTAQLVPLLLSAPSPRVTTVSSGAANLGLRRINFEDMQWERSYRPWRAYCQSKLADLMFMLELGRRSASAKTHITSNSAHPGYARTNLQTSGPGRPQGAFGRLMASILSQDAADGALPTLRAATDKQTVSGDYFGPGGVFGMKGDPVHVRIPRPALDEGASGKLWEIAEGSTRTTFNFDILGSSNVK